MTATRYLQAVGLSAHSVGMESGGLHSTMMAVPRPPVATVTSADLAENSTIDSSQLSSLRNEDSGPAAGLGRVVDSQAISDALGKQGFFPGSFLGPV